MEKKIQGIQAPTLPQLLAELNNLKVTKEDLVMVDKIEGSWTALYYN